MSVGQARRVVDGNVQVVRNIPRGANGSLGDWRPTDYGMIAWTFDPVMIFSGNQPLNNGRLCTAGLIVPQSCTITNIILNVGTAGSGLTSGQNFAALYQNGVLLGTTADQTTNWQSAGNVTAALTTPQPVIAGRIDVALFSNGTTKPQFGGGGAVTGPPLANPRWGIYDGSYTTAMPSTLPTMTNKTWSPWAAVS